MTRKTTGACLALLVVALAAAWAAAPAQAELAFQSWETVQYGESEEESEDLLTPTNLSAAATATEPIAFGLGGIKVRCSTATATSTLATGSSPTIDLAPTYSGCKAAVLWPVEINTSSCVLREHLASETETGVFAGSTDIVCGGGGQIVAKVSLSGKTVCTVRIGPQTGLKTSKAIDMNEDTPDDFTLKSELTSITATVEKGEGMCPVAPGSYPAEYSGNMLVTAKGIGGEVPPPRNAQPRKIEKFHFQLKNATEVEIIGGAQTAQVFEFDAGKVSCANALSREEANGLTTLTALDVETNFYEECTDVGGEKAAVIFNSCVFRIRAGTVEQRNGRLESGVNVACGPGGWIEVAMPECTVTIKSQSGVDGEGIRRAFVRDVGGKEVKVGFVLTGIQYEELEGAACVLPKVVKKNGDLTGEMLFRALEEGGAKAQVPLWPQITP